MTNPAVADVIGTALAEDLAGRGDVTSAATVSADTPVAVRSPTHSATAVDIGLDFPERR